MIPPALGRLAYRIAYVLLIAGSHVVRPHTRGVKCLLLHDGDVLLVRHSYGPGTWDLPGGFCKRGERFEAAARREVDEELGVADVPFTDLGEIARRFHGRHETLHGFRAELPAHGGAMQTYELAEARWFPRAAMPERRSAIVDEVAALAGLPVGGGG